MLDLQEEDNIPKEKKMEGAVGLKTYTNFFKAGYGSCVWCCVILFFALGQAAYLCADWWLSYWYV